MIELWLFRHGQTEDNIKKAIQGHSPGKLTNLGQKQAVATGIRLKNEVFDYIYCSDLGRAKHTFELMQQQMPYAKNIKPEYSSLIREKGGGILEGQPIILPKQMAQEQNIPFRQFKAQGAESWNDVNFRANQFFRKLIDTYLRNDIKKINQTNDQSQQKDESNSLKNEQQQQQKVKILVVSHGGYIMEFFNVINNLIDGRQPTVNNSSINCALHIIKLKCKKNNGKCTGECKDYSCIQPEIILTNDNSHVIGLL